MNARNGLWMMAAILSIVTACNYTVGECYPRGDSDAAAVGVGPSGAGPSGAGGFGDMPPGGGTGADACNKTAGKEDPGSAASSSSGGPDDTELSTYIRCLGQGPKECSAQCFAAGAYCVEYAVHPENPSIGIGPLKQCMEGLLSYTCTYCYPNGDVCSFICALKGCGFGKCTNTGGKGCE